MTILLVAITIIVSLIAFSNPTVMNKGMLNPYQVHHRHEYWRLITSGFLHADTMHLLVNMMVLYSFGTAVEYYFDAYFGSKGTFYFLVLYLGGILVANAPSVAKHKDNHYYNSLGASGAVSSILFAAILFAPWTKVYLFFVIGIPGILLGPLYLFYEYKMSQRGGTGINHDAHFMGAIFGLLFTIILKPQIFLDFIEKLMNPI
jgi:membrane associated rhomboid family serine protease